MAILANLTASSSLVACGAVSGAGRAGGAISWSPGERGTGVA